MDEQLKRDIERAMAGRAQAEREAVELDDLSRLTSDAGAFKAIGPDGWRKCIEHMHGLEITPNEIELVLRSDRMTTFATADAFIATFRRMTYGTGPKAFYE